MSAIRISGRTAVVALLVAVSSLFWGAGSASAAKPVASIADITVAEPEAPGDKAKARFTVSLSKKTTKSVTIHYDTGGETAQPPDYVAMTGRVKLKDERKVKIQITVNGDDEVEGDQTFHLSLYDAKGATIDAEAGTATATITDSD